MGATMDKPQQGEPVKMTLDELFKRTFSQLLAYLIDTFSISEEQPPSAEDEPSGSPS